MTDILDELYDEFKLLVTVVTDELRERGSFLLVWDEIDEDLADGIAATASTALGLPVFPFVYGKPYSLLSGITHTPIIGESTTAKYYINCPVVLACPTELENVWHFYIERNE